LLLLQLHLQLSSKPVHKTATAVRTNWENCNSEMLQMKTGALYL
jgi:hypothetical protein